MVLFSGDENEDDDDDDVIVLGHVTKQEIFVEITSDSDENNEDVRDYENSRRRAMLTRSQSSSSGGRRTTSRSEHSDHREEETQRYNPPDFLCPPVAPNQPLRTHPLFKLKNVGWTFLAKQIIIHVYIPAVTIFNKLHCLAVSLAFSNRNPITLITYTCQKVLAGNFAVKIHVSGIQLHSGHMGSQKLVLRAMFMYSLPSSF